MVQDKIFKSENICKILTGILRDGDKTIFKEKCVAFTIQPFIQMKIYQLFIRNFRSTKHL